MASSTSEQAWQAESARMERWNSGGLSPSLAQTAEIARYIELDAIRWTAS